MLLIPLLIVGIYLGFTADDWFILQAVGVLYLVMFVYGFISGRLGFSKLTNRRVELTLSYGGLALITLLAYLTA